jgi:hypothetical protein
MIGVESVLEAKHENQEAQCDKIMGQRIHEDKTPGKQIVRRSIENIIPSSLAMRQE